MNKHVLFWSITVGLGGMLFGLDVAVISGAELLRNAAALLKF